MTQALIGVLLTGDHVNTWQQSLRSWVATNAIALVAIVLSVAGFWWGTLGPERRRRKAEQLAFIEVRFEVYPVTRTGARGEVVVSNRDRFVLHNHGPAAATDVSITRVETDGAQASKLLRDVRFPIPRLAPGQEFHIPAFATFGTGLPHTVEIQWTDTEQRSDERWVTAIHLT